LSPADEARIREIVREEIAAAFCKEWGNAVTVTVASDRSPEEVARAVEDAIGRRARRAPPTTGAS
jgi:hypothetical protein